MTPAETLDSATTQRLRELERDLNETERALATETLDHARTKETLAYTRGLLDRADKSETAIHKFLDKQEDRHQQSVGKLEEKVIDANRKIATIARELGAKEERVALLTGPARLPGQTPEDALPKPQDRPLSMDVPLIWSALGAALTVGIWTAPGWTSITRGTASSAVWGVIAWCVFKFWSEIALYDHGARSAKALRLRNLCRTIGVFAALLTVAFLGIAYFFFDGKS